MRVTGGVHRGRRLAVPAGRDVRPTTDKVRQALFNILAHGDLGRPGSADAGPGEGGADPVDGAVVLDAFCGTGALALEALSRGAASAVLMDADRRSLEAARANADGLGEGARVALVRADATRPPPPRGPAAGLAFLDPPYGRDLAAPAILALDRAGWLAPGVLVVVETRSDDGFVPPAGWDAVDDRRWGATRATLLRRAAGT